MVTKSNKRFSSDVSLASTLRDIFCSISALSAPPSWKSSCRLLPRASPSVHSSRDCFSARRLPSGLVALARRMTASRSRPSAWYCAHSKFVLQTEVGRLVCSPFSSGGSSYHASPSSTVSEPPSWRSNCTCPSDLETKPTMPKDRFSVPSDPSGAAKVSRILSIVMRSVLVMYEAKPSAIVCLATAV